MEYYQALKYFFFANGYVFELSFAISLFACFLKRRDHFVLRALLAFAALMVFSVVWSYTVKENSTFLLKCVKYIFMGMICGLGLYCSMNTSIWGVLFCLTGGTAAQHCAYRLYSAVIIFSEIRIDSMYSFLITLVLMASVYLTVFLVFARRIRNGTEKAFENKLNIILELVLVIFSVFLHFLNENYISPAENWQIYITVSLYAILCCIFTLALQYGLFHSEVLSYDNIALEHLLHIQEEQYRISKENIDIINIKCHDMKHQISRLEGRIGETELKEIRKAIAIYDTTIKTGNEALDILLAEKRLICETDGISFDCIVNGEALLFLMPSEIYALFGNAIDNAIAAIRKIESPDRRIISLIVKNQLNMVSVHLENCYDGEIQFVDGLPETDNPDKNNHGFGVRSIKMIVEKYKGNVVFSGKDGVFNMNIIFPKS